MTQVGHKSVHGLWQPSEATRSALSKDSLPLMHSVLKDQEWCIYGIIYHYAPFLLSNPMVTISGPNYVITNQVPSPSPISKKDFSDIQSGNSLAATRRPFKDPNYLALQRLGYHFLIRTSLGGNSQRLSIFSIIVKASRIQHSLDNSIGPYR
ncbi:hypothetical protein O181_028542 [Austropuccinia psidii MF-1]|uniref:Uncharacterized protein n=1 Tax=Austropuccinia psidii MF-1 TaxID=1389203 RepID=A0A9Q3CS38_9BASI|nr:hypothetical protein [Austropuccinia psidii MF-1]